MDCRLTNLKNLGSLCTAIASLFIVVLPSQAFSISFDNTDFSQASGTVDNDASSTGNINSGTTPNGFGGVFTSDYLLLGAEDSDANIGASVGGTTTVLSSAFVSTPFVISSTSDDVTLEFDWAFQGDSSNEDEFNIGILGPGGSGFTSFFDRGSTMLGSNLGESVTRSGFTPGSYQLAIQLNEAGGFFNNNTAAGFDNISIDGITEEVPLEFSPSIGLIMMGGIFVANRYFKHRKTK